MLSANPEIARPSCSVKLIPNQRELKNKNLVLLDLHCEKHLSNSDGCLNRKSFISYTCEKSFIFENKKGIGI